MTARSRGAFRGLVREMVYAGADDVIDARRI